MRRLGGEQTLRRKSQIDRASAALRVRKSQIGKISQTITLFYSALLMISQPQDLVFEITSK